MKHVSRAAASRRTHDTGFVAPGVTGDVTGGAPSLSLGVLFAGGGVFSADLAPGCHVAWAVEYDKAIAAVHQLNHPGALTIVSGVEDVDYAALPPIDILQASPECKEFSAAKTSRTESETQLGQARAICRALRYLRPRGFILENVRGYIGSESLKLIGQTLYDLDYCMDQQVVNAADYGVPQTRERLIVRARAGGFMGCLPPIPGRVSARRGWYQAIADLIPTLPESRFADWQLKRIEAAFDKGMDVGGHVFVGGANKSESFIEFAIENRPTIPGVRAGDVPMTAIPADSATNMAGRAFIVSNAATEYSEGVRGDTEPMFGVTAQSSGRARAFIVDQQNGGREPTVKDEAEPIFTITQYSIKHPPPRAWLTTGRVVAMTPRCLARFQSIPDSFVLPDNRRLAATVVGNGVPSLIGRLVVESLRYD